MSNIIQFLEAVGSRPALSIAEYAATVAALDTDATQQQALLDRDHAALNRLLAGREKMVCAIWPVEEPVQNDVN